MFSLEKLFSHAPRAANGHILPDDAAALLKASPEALSAFEEAYKARELKDGPSDNFFDVNSRQMTAMRHGTELELPVEQREAARHVVDRVVAELLAKTSVYFFDGDLARVEAPRALPAGTPLLTNDDISALPEALRPELTGNLMKMDCPVEPPYLSILFAYQRYQDAKTPKERASAYGFFRQGLDILDLDEITYRIIGMNRVSMGHWFPQLVDACRGNGFFRLPATAIAKVPLPLLQLTRLQYEEHTSTTMDIVDRWAFEAFKLDEEKEYFIKTGTYSSKFDFRNALVRGPKEVRELGEYLLFIHYQANHMASPLVKPAPIYGVSTTNEWVVREYIRDKEANPCIYHGMPLHTEYRVFVDCDTDEVLSIVPYWESETMKHRFASEGQPDSPKQMHDYVIYKAHEDVLMGRYHEHESEVRSHIRDILPGLTLEGQWSIDVMQNGDEFWIIDMAPAENSYFYDSVPPELRRPVKENWLPRLDATEGGV